ncbi:peptidylprolyl isomerase [Rickettsia endosymbiont of Cardiosporidium cionae]|uniref:peptidylprolyl isomerase n=1 Tax=Rickettsia endosymbiont of Cardiosporidium cionae TaxID=2777155 RepID=UPI00189561FB|nr:SurA N-terminal domain-containing protein [Rickettsia endosymbiont of Cardiosporidium cionae]KAF8818651.1 peptidylprolyl isomerase [Rickettsia endosymbiont of Cardiosporidium cionae]
MQLHKNFTKFILKLLLTLVIISFIGFQSIALFQSSNTEDYVVTFSNGIKNISKKEFVKLKKYEIEDIQKKTNKTLTENEILHLGIDNRVIQKLINKSVLEYFIKYYNLNLSNNYAINFIKTLEYFQDSNNNFDPNIFRSYFSGASDGLEKQYIKEVKGDLLRQYVAGVFLDIFLPSKILAKNFLYYIAEERVVDIVKYDLKKRYANSKSSNPTKDQINEIYEATKQEFLVPEQRSFSYVFVNSDTLNGQTIPITYAEIKAYYEENIEDFSGKSLAQSKPQIVSLLRTMRNEEKIINYIKDFESEIEAGSNLSQIAKKFRLKPISINNINRQSMDNNKNPILAEISNQVFDMIQDELSYPIELNNQSGIVVVELYKIMEERQQTLEEVEPILRARFYNKQLISNNISKFAEFKKKYTTNNQSKSKDFLILKNNIFSRSDFLLHKFSNNHDIPYNLMREIFNIKKGDYTDIYQNNVQEAFFARLNAVQHRSLTEKKLADTKLLDNITQHIKNEIFQEIVKFITIQHDMKLHHSNIT